MKKNPLLYPTITACASATGIPKTRLIAWKNDGKPGFKANGGVALNELLPAVYSDSNGPDLDASRARLNEARIKELERKAKTQAGELAPTDEQARALSCLAHLFIATVPDIAYRIGHSVGATDPSAATKCIKEALIEWIRGSAKTAASVYKLPPWAIEAFARGASRMPDEIADFIRDVDLWRIGFGARVAFDDVKYQLEHANDPSAE